MSLLFDVIEPDEIIENYASGLNLVLISGAACAAETTQLDGRTITHVQHGSTRHNVKLDAGFLFSEIMLVKPLS